MSTFTPFPSITNDNKSIGGATHEIHIFLLPTDPDDDTIEKYYDVVRRWNSAKHVEEEQNWQLKSAEMKGCHLSLEYLNDYAGIATPTHRQVRVMQSARYVYDNDMQKVIEAAQRDARFFRKAGFSVARIKIEASAYGNKGIPFSDEDARNHIDCYFEFHVKVSGSVATTEHLRATADLFSKQYQVPVPFSHNLNPHQKPGDHQGKQLFFNMRFRKTGLDRAQIAIDHLKRNIQSFGELSLVKVIAEYVWYDTFPEMDRGWIE